MAGRRKSSKNGNAQEGSQSAERDHNAKHRRNIMRDAAARITQLKAEKAAIQAEITNERGKIKSLGIKAREFNFVLTLTELEIEDRNVSLDGLRECFAALLPGEQLDFITAGEEALEDDGTPVGAAHEAGHRAGLAGKPQEDNPYPPGTRAHAAWLEDWTEAQADLASHVGTGENHPTV